MYTCTNDNTVYIIPMYTCTNDNTVYIKPMYTCTNDNTDTKLQTVMNCHDFRNRFDFTSSFVVL